jgi:hypothetical protein
VPSDPSGLLLRGTMCGMTSGAVTDGISCLLTIHGIGFQQFPDDAKGLPGYADGLHERLHPLLDGLLSDDPQRAHPAPGANGAIYVQSSWPPDAEHPEVRSIEEGLARLGRRRPDGTVDITGAPLVQAGRRIAHVALVYTPLEPTRPDHLSTLETALRGLVGIEHYTTLHAAARDFGADLVAVLHPPRGTEPDVTAGNRPRQDLPHRGGLLRRVVEHVHPAAASPGPSDPLSVLRTVEEDVAEYVARNQLREQVRDFVREALLRLHDRGDVSHVVVNSHSQGTVVAFDVLRTLTQPALGLVDHWMTLGSPLRKYATLLAWGRETGCISAIPRWTNMWDGLDPVADPLSPAPPWRRGDSDPATAAPGLFRDLDMETGVATPHPLTDVRVDNVHHVPASGLPAHDYWDNVEDVVPRMAGALREVTAAPAVR